MLLFIILCLLCVGYDKWLGRFIIGHTRNECLLFIVFHDFLKNVGDSKNNFWAVLFNILTVNDFKSLN